jgi:hypothetical protein
MFRDQAPHLPLACFLLFNGSTNVRSTAPSADVSGRAPERRIHHRVLAGAAAWLIIGEARYPAECVNISMGGAALRTDAPVSTGSILHFELSLGLDRGSVSIQCEVVRAAKTDVGLRFMALDRASLEAILALL